MALITSYWGLDGIVVFLSLIAVAYLYMTRKFKYWKKRGILEIAPTPFIGNFSDCFMMKKTPGNFVMELYNHGKGLPYMGFYVFDKPYFLVRDPELVKHVLVKDFNTFSNRYAATRDTDRLGYANLFLIRNPGWKLLRTKLSPIYTSGKMKKLYELMLEIGKDLDSHLEALALTGDGKAMEVKDIAAKFTTDLIGSTAFGLKVNSLNDPNAEFRKYGQKIFEYNFSRGFELTSVFFLPHLVKYINGHFFGKEATNFLRSVFWETINQRMASGIKRNDLIDTLIELKKKHENDGDLGGFRMDGDDLVAQAAVFFSGGFETSSTTTSFSLYELACNPDIQTRLRKEILDALSDTDGNLSFDTIMSLPYLGMVVDETLRKYPPLPFLDRVAGEDYKVPNSDIVLEKGTPVFISMTGMHYDPEYFPDPEKFDPERFSPENKKNIKPFTYFPFGEGPHICIGMRLGLLQSKLALVHMLKNHEYSPCERTLIPMQLDPKALTTTALGGLYLNIRKITTEAG